MGEATRIVAWMGGSPPDPYNQISRQEKALVSVLFREQCGIFSHYWGDLPMDIARTFWLHARYDAHATLR